MKRPYHFLLKKAQSPTHYNLSRYLQEQGWRSSRFNWQVNFSDENLQFHLKAAQTLEFKHLLAQLVEQYCPQVMPLTYCINDQNWPAVLQRITNAYYLKQDYQLVDQIDDLVWILKPALLNNGKDIKIFQQISELERHFLSSNRLGGEHVLQQYLINPHLLRDKRKYSIRMFVVTTNYAGAYLYPYGYFNVSMYPYMAREFSDLRSHLTNEHLQEDTSNVLQIPSQRFAWFTSIYPQIKEIVAVTIKGLQQLYPQAFVCDKQRTLAIFGFDFMIDNEGHLWLLEANHGPCFPISDAHPLQKYLYYEFWQALITSFVKPIALHAPVAEIQYELFQLL
jgi:Tubulin-tyrosine ligase family